MSGNLFQGGINPSRLTPSFILSEQNNSFNALNSEVFTIDKRCRMAIILS